MPVSIANVSSSEVCRTNQPWRCRHANKRYLTELKPQQGHADCVQDYLDSIFDAAEAIPQDANKALLIFDALVLILQVDVNVAGINRDVAVGGTMLASLAQQEKLPEF